MDASEYKKFAVVLTTGSEVILKRFYQVNMTYAHIFPNQIIVSDEDGNIGVAKIHKLYLRRLLKRLKLGVEYMNDHFQK